MARGGNSLEICDRLAQQYPKVLVLPDPIFHRDGSVYTSAGITAGIDLSIALVEEEHGHKVALEIAQYLVMFLVRPGGQAQSVTCCLIRRLHFGLCGNCRFGSRAPS